MYSFNSRIRFSEVDVNRKLDLTGIINYFQDCSTFHSEDVGLGINSLLECNQHWILANWQIVVYRYPSLGEEVTISTWPYGFKAMYGFRNYTISDKDGNLLVVGDSTWVLMDFKNNRPAKVDPSIGDKYGMGKRFPLAEAPRKMRPPIEFTEREPILVTKSHLDMNNHVNNGQYIKIATDYLPSGFIVKEMRAEYRNSAILGDIIIPKITLNEDRCTIVLSSEENQNYCIIEFYSKEQS